MGFYFKTNGNLYLAASFRIMKSVLLSCFLLLTNSALQAQSFDPVWYTSLSVDSFFKTEASQRVIDVEFPDVELLNAAIFFAANEMRVKRGLTLFVHDAALERAAVFHSNEMRTKRFFNHLNKGDRENRTPDQRINNNGGSYNVVGENILEMPPYKTGPKGEYDVEKQADGSYLFLQVKSGKPLKVMTYGDFARAAVKLWMRSPEHKANIMSKEFTHLGCGVGIEDNPYSYRTLPMVLVTQNFGANISEE